MCTLSLECSKKLYALLGEYETEQRWSVKIACLRGVLPEAYLIPRGSVMTADKYSIPAPNFAETIRLLPKIGEKKGWGTLHIHGHTSTIANDVMMDYMLAPTPEEGMERLSEYLMKLL